MKESNLPQVDQELLTQVQHFINALTDPTKYITQRPGFIAAIGEMQGALQEALAHHKAKISAITTDIAENKMSAGTFAEAARAAIEEYGILRDAAAKFTRSQLRRPIPAKELERNTAFFARVFSVYPSSIEELRDAAMVGSLRSTADALSAAPFALPSEDVQAFLQALAALEAAQKGTVDESRDDVSLQGELEDARAQAAALLAGAQNVLRGFLRIEKSRLSVEEFVSRRNEAPATTLDIAGAITPSVAPAESP